MATMPMQTHISSRALATLLPTGWQATGPAYRGLADAITALVLDGRIALDTRLPSERDLARQLAISRATVTAGYDQLRADGFLASRTGAGSFVTLPRTTRPRMSPALWMSPAEPSDVIDLSCASLPAPREHLMAAVAEASGRLPAHSCDIGYDPSGLAELRQAVADRFTRRGLPTTPEQILITDGALHGFSLLLRALAGPGDRVLTELPSYPGALDAIQAANARILPVPMTSSAGWDVAAIAAAMRQTAPTLAFVVPDFQNPTGSLMGVDARRELTRAARRTGTTLIVDESFVELGLSELPAPMATFDRSVVTLGSLSKPVWAGLRIGWVRAGTDLIRRLTAARAATDLAGSVLDQLVGIALFDRLDEIARERRAQLRAQRDALVSAVAEHLPTWRLSRPQGGLSLWAELPTPQATTLTMGAAQRGVLLVSGSRFGVDGTLERFARLPYALPSPRLEEAVARLAQAWAELDGTTPALAPLVVA